MLLSSTSEYAIRAATHIAQHGDEAPVLAKDIAEQMNVPLKYLQKVLRDLVRSGVLSSTRGIGGGFRISGPIHKIRLADVVAPFGESWERSTCPFGNPDCGTRNLCPIHERWMQVLKAYATFLETTTLADLVQKSTKKEKKRRKTRKR